jgi:hypothetical protein
MEGARMTDEWPFIEQRLPDRNVVFIQVDPDRELVVVEPVDDDFDDLGFSFSDTPEEKPVVEKPEPVEGQVTPDQKLVYFLVNGVDDIHEVILSSPLIEFETCKALAELMEARLIRERMLNEIANVELLTNSVEGRSRPSALRFVPWLAIPFLILLGFAFTVLPRNPVNPSFSFKTEFWERYVIQSQSWLQMDWLARIAETDYFLHGFYPAGLEELSASRMESALTADPWGRPYRIAIRGDKLMFTGSDSQGQPVPMLIHSRNLVWEGETPESGDRKGPGLILLP